MKIASVLIGLLDGNVILTKRSANLRSFTGHVCLPGGGVESGNDLVASDAAMREFCEELEYTGDIESIYCMLPEYSVVSSQIVYPVVARLNGKITGLNVNEVDKLILLPVDMLTLELFEINRNYPNIKHNKGFMWDGEYVWGLTAHILYKFVGLYAELKEEL